MSNIFKEEQHKTFLENRRQEFIDIKKVELETYGIQSFDNYFKLQIDLQAYDVKNDLSLTLKPTTSLFFIEVTTEKVEMKSIKNTKEEIDKFKNEYQFWPYPKYQVGDLMVPQVSKKVWRNKN